MEPRRDARAAIILENVELDGVQMLFRYLTQAVQTEQCHVPVHLSLKNVRCHPNSVYATDRSGIEERAADEHKPGSHSQGFQDVGSASYGTIHHDNRLSANGSDDCWKGVERRERAVELSSTMVRYDDPVDAKFGRFACVGFMQDSFDHEVTLPSRANALQMGPV